MKDLQNIDLLKKKRRLAIEQMKLTKQASLTTQACDTGDLHKQERHHVNTLTIEPTTTQGLINPLEEAIPMAGRMRSKHD